MSTPIPERQFPILGARDNYGKPITIPWSWAEPIYEKYAARFGRDQSMGRLAARGGLDVHEIVTLLLDIRP